MNFMVKSQSQNKKKCKTNPIFRAAEKLQGAGKQRFTPKTTKITIGFVFTNEPNLQEHGTEVT